MTTKSSQAISLFREAKDKNIDECREWALENHLAHEAHYNEQGILFMLYIFFYDQSMITVTKDMPTSETTH